MNPVNRFTILKNALLYGLHQLLLHNSLTWNKQKQLVVYHTIINGIKILHSRFLLSLKRLGSFFFQIEF